MKVVVLCGGAGTRLRAETEFRPKPMIEVGGRPILWHIMKLYAHYGFSEFVLCLGYKGNAIKEYFLNYEAMNNDFSICLGERSHIRYHDKHTEQGFSVTLADTGLETQTAGRIRKIRKYLGEETFLLTYGDGVSDVNIRNVLDFHQSHGKLATVTTVRPISRFGMIELAGGDRVGSFNEKPKTDGWMNAGFFVMNPGVMEYMGGDSSILEHEPMQQLVAAGELMAYRHEGFFYAMDTFREYQNLNDMWNHGAAPWKVWS